jgi:hypothetical protein
MEIDTPAWHLKQPCENCGQGSCLILVACPSCNHLAVICAECSAVFPNAAQTALKNCSEGETTCPVCNKKQVVDFRVANSGQIQAAGLLPSQYC